MKNNVLNVLDIVTLVTSALGLSVTASEIETWLTIACTIICLISGVTTLILRVISLFKKYTSDDSDGGKKLTSEEIDDITATIESGITSITNKTKQLDKKEGDNDGKNNQ